MFVNSSLAPCLVDGSVYIVVRFPVEDICKSTKNLLNHTSKDQERGTTQRLQEDTRRGSIWEAPAIYGFACISRGGVLVPGTRVSSSGFHHIHPPSQGLEALGTYPNLGHSLA